MNPDGTPARGLAGAGTSPRADPALSPSGANGSRGGASSPRTVVVGPTPMPSGHPAASHLAQHQRQSVAAAHAAAQAATAATQQHQQQANAGAASVSNSGRSHDLYWQQQQAQQQQAQQQQQQQQYGVGGVPAVTTLPTSFASTQTSLAALLAPLLPPPVASPQNPLRSVNSANAAHHGDGVLAAATAGAGVDSLRLRTGSTSSSSAPAAAAVAAAAATASASAAAGSSSAAHGHSAHGHGHGHGHGGEEEEEEEEDDRLAMLARRGLRASAVAGSAWSSNPAASGNSANAGPSSSTTTARAQAPATAASSLSGVANAHAHSYSQQPQHPQQPQPPPQQQQQQQHVSPHRAASSSTSSGGDNQAYFLTTSANGGGGGGGGFSGGASGLEPVPVPAAALSSESFMSREGILGLSDDLVAYCASFLDVSDLARLAATCQRLRHAVYHTVLWASLDLTAFATRVNDRVLLRLLRQPRFCRLQTLNLSGCTALTDKALARLPRLCPLLRTLTLTHCYNFTPDAVLAAATALPRLTRLGLANSPDDRAAVPALLAHARARGAAIDLGLGWLRYCADAGRAVDMSSGAAPPTCRHQPPAGGAMVRVRGGQVRATSFDA